MDGPAAVQSVLTEVELLAALGAERVLDEPLSAAIAQIEPQRHGAFVEKAGTILIVEPFEQFLHLLEMILVVPIAAAAVGRTAGRRIFNGLKHLDLHDMANIGVRVDRAFAQVARVMEHAFLRGGSGPDGHRDMDARHRAATCEN
jgi:hypothetical protein